MEMRSLKFTQRPTHRPLSPPWATSEMNIASFVGKVLCFYPSCKHCFTQTRPCLRIYSCPCDEMQSIWGKLMFGCDARLHRDDEQLRYRTECSASTGNKKKNTITCYWKRQCGGMAREKKTQIKLTISQRKCFC